MYQKQDHVTNLKSGDVLIRVLINGLRQMILNGPPSDKIVTLWFRLLDWKKVYADHDCPAQLRCPTPVHAALMVSVTHQFEWWDGQYYQIVALEQTFVCFCIDKMTLNFSCKNYTTKCQFLTLVKHFYLSGVEFDFDEFRAKTAQNWQFVKKVKKVWNYQLILTFNF